MSTTLSQSRITTGFLFEKLESAHFTTSMDGEYFEDLRSHPSFTSEIHASYWRHITGVSERVLWHSGRPSYICGGRSFFFRPMRLHGIGFLYMFHQNLSQSIILLHSTSISISNCDGTIACERHGKLHAQSTS